MKTVPHLSFEFFPPKSSEGMTKLNHVALSLESLAPDFYSVTFGAGGSTRDGTLNTLMELQKNTAVSIAPHLSCIGCTREALTQIIENYKKLGVKRIVALRGDLPSGMGQSGDLRYASDLVELIRKTTGDHFHIEVGAYPEFHPQTSSAHDEIMNFKKKIDAGANSAITQYFFNSDAYFYYLDQCAKANIFVPITPGIMPITQFSKLVRFSDSCGAEIPRWIRKRLETFGDDQESIQALGLEIVYDLCQKLLSGGAPGLHFYTLNHAEMSLALVRMLQASGAKRMTEKEL